MRILYIKLLITGIVFSVIVSGNAVETVDLEDRIKAVFIYNFTKYIEWPEAAESETFEMAVIGYSNIIIPLKEIEQKELVNNKKINVRHYASIDDISMCHILFISASEKNQLHDILQKIRYENILTVSDSNGFAGEGVAINFVLVEGKIKFEINSSAINQAGLQVSSQLLKLAILIEERKSDD